jgi:CHAD domain-containing protein
VFLTELAPTGRRDKATKTMLDAAQTSRHDAQARVAAALVGARYRRFLARLNLWLEGTAWRAQTNGGDTSAATFARTELNRRLAKIQKRSKHIDTAPPADLHALRIAIKKLRYGLEFFQSLLPPRRTARIGRLLKSLQDSLGKLNDLDVAQRTVTTLATRAGSAAVRHTIESAGSRLSKNFKPLAKSAQPEATRIAERLRAQKLL